MTIFIVVAVLTIAGGSYLMYTMNMGYGALLFFAGSLYVFILYGMRWFGTSGLFGVTPGPWPPIINTCPDYLTYYQRTYNGTKVDTCVDMIGVSKAGMTKFDETKGDTNPDDSFFSLHTVSNDPTAKNAELCQRAISMGLSWEGITNGDGCVSAAGTITGPSTSGSSTCH